ncbi:branched-chain amino acid ABC transporter permease [Desulforhabdus amnigena]|jgi:branched-chain amino acid transport system permease protein|uniref:Branched-chain amino acid ABC transporter permease n=1 Tax=Desulforhabdus amnigena TaxID=40218 RepID=A0A9W6D4E2_9BACT|nr:branched-chain amino acid ABC transporter permease [Desulforhabdus amnigena]NLJ27288.1 branched-chain amino acid ABC transporter permease [Deltaproteobacteria bacterium]GLI32936.1 branched-chain amino acid ABC transporter permease [Desulforhabdus amnigena]
MKLPRWSTLVSIVVLLLFPLLVPSDYYRHIFIIALMWVVIGSSWNLLAGFTGQVSFGHAIFFGTGAYTAGLCASKLGISAWWGMLLGGPVALLVGCVIGWICFRLRGPYFALATIAIGEIFRLVATDWRSLTEGMEGILIIQTFRSKIPYYYLALFLAGACVFVIDRIMQSKWGYYFIAIREDQDSAEAIGISSFRYKSLSLMVSSFFTGLAGALYMNYMAFIDPHVVFALHDISIMAILVGIIGGVGTLWGPPAGAFIMVLLQETFRSSFFGLLPSWVSESHVLVFGLLVIFVIRFMANGLVGDWPKIQQLWSRSKQTLPANGGN